MHAVSRRKALVTLTAAALGAPAVLRGRFMRAAARIGDDVIGLAVVGEHFDRLAIIHVSGIELLRIGAAAEPLALEVCLDGLADGLLVLHEQHAACVGHRRQRPPVTRVYRSCRESRAESWRCGGEPDAVTNR